MKTSKLFLVGVILASLVSFGFARDMTACFLKNALGWSFNQNVVKCVRIENKSIAECKEKHKTLKDQSDEFARKCYGSN